MQTSRTQDLTSGSITQSMLNLAYPLILGNLLQQSYYKKVKCGKI